jgi:putative spermidine/putrescine transport system permease protein
MSTLAMKQEVERRPGLLQAMLPKAAEWQLVLPLGVFFMVFLVGPLALLFVVSLFTDTSMQTFGLSQYIQFFSEKLSLDILLDTLLLGLYSTIVCLVLGFPMAFAYCRAPARWKAILLFLIILPQLTSAVVRTFAWIVILGREGIINNTLLSIGMIADPLTLLYTKSGVILALAQIQLPLMVLPLINTLMRIDNNVVEASTVLGAGAWRTFRKVILPLSMPGVIAGSLLVYTTSIGAFVTQSVIGGGRLMYMPEYIYQLSIGAQNWPFAAAVTMILLGTVMMTVMIFTWAGRRSMKHVGA